jgi:hypothetical protein
VHGVPCVVSISSWSVLVATNVGSVIQRTVVRKALVVRKAMVVRKANVKQAIVKLATEASYRKARRCAAIRRKCYCTHVQEEYGMN